MAKTKVPPYQRQNKMLVALVEKYLSLSDLKKEDAAVKIRMARATFYRRLRAPEEFTLEELRRLVSLMGFTPDEILKVVIG